MTTSLIPGRDLSYADLTGTISKGGDRADDISRTWSATGRFAEALGIETMMATGASVRSLTTGELIEKIVALLDEDLSESALLDLISTSADEIEGRNRKVTYEVRRLRYPAEAKHGGKVWKLVQTMDTVRPAEEKRDALIAEGATAIVVRVVELWEWDRAS